MKEIKVCSRAAKTVEAAVIIALSLAAATAAQSGEADTARNNADTGDGRLSIVVVVATRSPRPVADVAATVTAMDAAQLEDLLAVSTSELGRYEPSFSVTRAGTRFGWGSFNLRGVGGNRVAIEVDGVPVADRFAIGSYSDAQRDLVDLDFIRRVEVLYGPASTLYGSDALGGVVAYQTYRPADLADDERPYLAWRTGYRDDDQSWHTGLTGAWLNGPAGVAASVSYRDGQQRDSAARGAAPEDWQHWDSLNLSGKLDWQLGEGHGLSAAIHRFERDAATTLRSFLGSGRFRSTTRLAGDDTQRREQLSITYDFDAAGVAGRLIAYRQSSATDQFSVEERAVLDIRRQRLFGFEQRRTGLKFNGTHTLGMHTLGFGLDLGRTATTEFRDAWQTTLAGEQRTNVLLGETFPVRDFPNSHTTQAGIYLHDEIEFGDFMLIPALRYDSYDLEPRPDALYREDNPQTEVVSLTEHNLAPKLGLIWSISERLSLFGQYARGFRAPPFEDANIGLDIPLFNIRALPNPDLQSEVSDGLELGLRRHTPSSALSVSAYYTRFDDFIETKARIGVDPDTGVILFQSRNLARASIRGAELRWRQALGNAMEIGVAATWTHGENEVSGQRLNTIDPAQLVVRLGWTAPRLPLGSALALTATRAGQAAGDESAALARTAGFGVIDWTARYQPSRRVELRAGVFNLLDKSYWHWASVRGLDAGDPTLPLLAEPGRHAGVSAKLIW